MGAYELRGDELGDGCLLGLVAAPRPDTHEDRWAADVARWLQAVDAAERAGVEIPPMLAEEARADLGLVAEARALAKAPYEAVVAWYGQNLLPDLWVDEDGVDHWVAEDEIDHALVLQLAIERNELAWAAAQLEELVRLGPEEVEHRTRTNERVRREACRRIRRWEKANPEPKAPAPWEQGTPGYNAAFTRWWRWSQEQDQRFSDARRRVIADLARPRRVVVRALRRGPRDRRPRSRRRARAPARPADEEPADVVRVGAVA